VRVRRVALIALLFGGFLTAASLPKPAAAVTLPLNFTDELVAPVSQPTAIDWTPDGRMLVTSKDGRVVIVNADGSVVPTPALDIGDRICTDGERGIEGLAVAPDFATTGYVFMYYSSKDPPSPTGECRHASFNRLVRLTMTGNTLGSEVILVDNMLNYAASHAAGDVEIGKDGNVYVTVGDGLCNYMAPANCAAANSIARSRHHLLGKVIRVTRDGQIPAGNPYQGANTARCNAGPIAVGMICQETFAWGLRNPFRFAFDPNAAGTRFFINDVGQNDWEEIDLGVAGADYGWNAREGRCATGSTTNCGQVAGKTNPIYSYHHDTGCRSITGGAFIPNGIWPAKYDGDYLFGDYACGKIMKRDRDTGKVATFVSGLGTSSAVHMAFGPYEDTKALYYTTFKRGGEVHRIRFTGDNTPPNAAFTATPTFGNAPLNVTFNASASNDPDADIPLSYEWDFGDGATLTTSSATTAHQYAAGDYTAELVVRDTRGVPSVPVAQFISAGNHPPTATMTSPIVGAKFFVDETITLTGSASDPEEGPLPNSALNWEVRRIHADHYHPWFNGTGNNLTFPAPAPEDLAAVGNSWLEVHLTVTDAHGLSREIVRTILPKKVSLTFKSDPDGRRININQDGFTATKTIKSWEGWRITVAAPDQGQWAFQRWSNGGPQSQVITTPAASKTYTAFFKRQLL
jgi:glucose/arabinose dehydrogenase